MATVEHKRQLRRAVADLAQCSIEDIESVWSALTPAEREQLRPLLDEASRAASGQAIALATADAPPAAPPGGDETHRAACSHLARAAASLPDELATRLLSCVTAPELADVLASLPDERRAELEARAKPLRISEKARAALREAALAAAPALADERPALSAPPTLRAALRRWIGRRG
ncbi:hypothetical protein FAZ69_11040 [Trinickia terrae]|uniref:Uncharacterized protein n=1 Tax=Trinickia terrae TaxID=2571161 RepID=A0A4U1I7S6_9BURK|nr:hypothetical protein [Trinickia terrae]TKC89459.1 hypothetical protein FAZ69_11040 [Trinickia terrae]